MKKVSLKIKKKKTFRKVLKNFQSFVIMRHISSPSRISLLCCVSFCVLWMLWSEMNKKNQNKFFLHWGRRRMKRWMNEKKIWRYSDVFDRDFSLFTNDGQLWLLRIFFLLLNLSFISLWRASGRLCLQNSSEFIIHSHSFKWSLYYDDISIYCNPPRYSSTSTSTRHFMTIFNESSFLTFSINWIFIVACAPLRDLNDVVLRTNLTCHFTHISSISLNCKKIINNMKRI